MTNSPPLEPTHQSVADLPPDWPGREHSEFVEIDGISWHTQRRGQGPTLLLVHGTGGSTHSWMRCVDALATQFDVLAIDLPGHGFTRVPVAIEHARDVFSLRGMSRAVEQLLRALSAQSRLVAGHSAGVPVLLQLCLDRALTPERVIGVNPALVAPPTVYTTLLAPLVGALVERDVIAETGAWLARGTGIIPLMLSSSGSPLTPEQLARYQWLCEQPGHIHAALTMMSRWDLPRLLRDTHALRTPLELIAGTRDRWVPPTALSRVAERLPNTTFRTIDAGHLIPEERPDVVVEAITRR